jgi:hypothetical protein
MGSKFCKKPTKESCCKGGPQNEGSEKSFKRVSSGSKFIGSGGAGLKSAPKTDSK